MKTHSKSCTQVDYSSVTPATGTSESNLPIEDSFANVLPTADVPTGEKARSNPDKTIPGPEAATAVDQSEQDQTAKGTK